MCHIFAASTYVGLHGHHWNARAQKFIMARGWAEYDIQLMILAYDRVANENAESLNAPLWLSYANIISFM